MARLACVSLGMQPQAGALQPRPVPVPLVAPSSSAVPRSLRLSMLGMLLAALQCGCVWCACSAPSPLQVAHPTPLPLALAFTLPPAGVLLTDTTLRDAHQSLLATRMRTHDMLKVRARIQGSLLDRLPSCGRPGRHRAPWLRACASLCQHLTLHCGAYWEAATGCQRRVGAALAAVPWAASLSHMQHNMLQRAPLPTPFLAPIPSPRRGCAGRPRHRTHPGQRRLAGDVGRRHL